MRSTSLAFTLILLGLAGCSDDDIGGSYDGTLTISQTGGQVVASMLASVDDDNGFVQLFPTGSNTGNLSCVLDGLDHDGGALSFNCAEHGCSCDDGQTNFLVKTASGTLANDLLTLTFAGDDVDGNAFNATFSGAFVAGTR